MPVVWPHPCRHCGPNLGAAELTTPRSYVYAIGRVEPRFPLLSLEKEFAQVAGRTATEGLTDQEVFQSVLVQPENRYLAQQMCWVFTISDLETYILYPRNPVDMDVLVGSLRARPRPTDVDVLVGIRGPVAPPEVCNGLTVPLVGFTQLYSFDRDSFISAVPRPARTQQSNFERSVEEILDRVLAMSDNVGGLDEHRAVNYLTLRYPGCDAKAYELRERDDARRHRRPALHGRYDQAPRRRRLLIQEPLDEFR